MSDKYQVPTSLKTSKQCACCGKTVANEDQQDHLATHHLGPHYFWFNARKFRTMEPSMTMAEIKRLADCNSSYQAYEERESGDIPWGDSDAVDLTHEPHFWAAPPATMFR